jgi:S-adenosylmethionine hydrolase
VVEGSTNAPPPIITFLSDFGLEDEFVGVCHAVIACRCPQARVIDIAHGIGPQDVRAGALLLAGAAPYLPAGVHLAVVDPGVGDPARRALALRTSAAGHLFVGPDNGLLMPAAKRLGGVAEVVEISRSRECLRPVSSTFHGRDVFAPVAAALAAGEPLAEVGELLDPGLLRPLELAVARLQDERLRCRVLHRDRFGNLVLDASGEQLSAFAASGAGIEVRSGGRSLAARRGDTFAGVGEGQLLLYEDSLAMAALAVNGGSAAQLLGASPGDELLLLRR